jgi:hypothetical protein
MIVALRALATGLADLPCGSDGSAARRPNETLPTAEDKVVKPSRRLSLVICFCGTQRVAARARHLVELALRCDAME